MLRFKMNEAYNRSRKQHLKDIELIDVEINRQCELGHFSLTITPKPTDGVLYDLQDRGFKINHISQDSVVIVWNHGTNPN